MKKFITYIILTAILFYLFPVLIPLIPLIGAGLKEMATLIISMIFILIFSFSFGIKNGFSFILFLLTVVIFLPYGLICYATARIIFAIVLYGISAVVGNSMGAMFRKK